MQDQVQLCLVSFVSSTEAAQNMRYYLLDSKTKIRVPSSDTTDLDDFSHSNWLSPLTSLPVQLPGQVKHGGREDARPISYSVLVHMSLKTRKLLVTMMEGHMGSVKGAVGPQGHLPHPSGGNSSSVSGGVVAGGAIAASPAAVETYVRLLYSSPHCMHQRLAELLQGLHTIHGSRKRKSSGYCTSNPVTIFVCLFVSPSKNLLAAADLHTVVSEQAIFCPMPGTPACGTPRPVY